LARGARKGVLDVIVVIRGGGARNELAVFDSARIAHTIAAVPVPVLTGLGHEIDRSIADEVAHTALKTPTACAGALIERVAAYSVDLEAAFEGIVRRSLATIDGAERRLHDVARRIAGRTNAAIERADERLAMRQTRLALLAPAALDRSTVRLDTAADRLLERSTSITERERSRLDVFAARVDAVDPAVQLARGWTITRNADGAIVRSAADIGPGDSITTDFLDGRTTSVIDTVDLHSTPDPTLPDDTESDPNR
jgi:exodeoxyribonuclease VII large subunit